MSKIITVTANTAIDSLVIARESGKQEYLRFPAGKGINVARTIETLGGRVVALGFVGQAEEPLFLHLSSRLLDVQLIPVVGATRTNTTTFDPGNNVTDHIRTQGFEVPSEAWLALFKALEDAMQPDDIVVVSGSLPHGSNGTAYEKLISLCRSHNVRAILDSSNGELRDGVGARPYMVKPNTEELLELVPSQQLNSEADIIAAAVRIWRDGIDLVVVSRGAAGVVVVYGAGPRCVKASVILDEPASPTGSVGSGDSLVAGMAFGLQNGSTVLEALRLGTACGAANVLALGPGVCSRADIERLSPMVIIEDLTSMAGHFG